MKVTLPGIRETLEACGPLTSRELMAFFPGCSQRHLSSALSAMRRLATKRIYIHSWVRENDYGKDYLRAVYAVGDQPDARKPSKLSNAERCKRWKAKTAIPKGASSVFAWAAAQAQQA